jgi:hypothetical protein
VSRVHYLPDKIQNKKPANPNIPTVRERPADDEHSWFDTRDAELERILNPFLDRNSALLGSIIFMATTILLLAFNAVYLSQGGNTDFWATLPVAVLVLCWDLSMGWMNRAETRSIVQQGNHRAESLDLDGKVSAIKEVGLAHDDHSKHIWVSWSVDARKVAMASNGASTEQLPSGNIANKCLGTTQRQTPVTGVHRVVTDLGVAETSYTTSDFRHRDGYITLFSFLEDRYK